MSGNTTPPLTPTQRMMLREFDALLDQYIAGDTIGRIEHPLHDTLGALAVVVQHRDEDNDLARRCIRGIEIEDNRLPKWMNADGSLK